MSKLSRRAFLRIGARRLPSEASEAPAPPLASAPLAPAPLPRVIAWLADADTHSEPPLPRSAPHAPLLRPPGAVAEHDFLARCTRCSDCIDACPHQAIQKAPPVFRSAANTPRIDPSSAPCRLCPELYCIAACTTGALAADGDPMGLAWVQELDCLGTQKMTCTVCQEHCPIEGAITYAAGVPKINRSLCVGCGACHYACPAPTNAIAILPNQTRRTLPTLNSTGEIR